jgi:hypothetical protein
MMKSPFEHFLPLSIQRGLFEQRLREERLRKWKPPLPRPKLTAEQTEQLRHILQNASKSSGVTAEHNEEVRQTLRKNSSAKGGKNQQKRKRPDKSGPRASSR